MSLNDSTDVHVTLKQATNMSDITWDEHYDNPDAKIILVSEDKVGFRVEAWYLKKKSGFIRDLLDFPSHQNIEETPIELEHDNVIIRHFLQLITPHVMPGVELDWPQLTELFRLCDKLQAPEADTSLMVAIRTRIQQRPLPTSFNIWGVFRLAGERDDVQLGKAAIRALETVEGSWDSLYRFKKVDTDLFLARHFPLQPVS